MFAASDLNSTVAEDRTDRYSSPHSRKVNIDDRAHSSTRTRSRCSGSPAEKAGLCVDDEVLAMNDETLENMTFEHVRKLLKERNLRGTIKLTVKTYDAHDPDSVVGNPSPVKPTGQHSRTPSPQKVIPSPVSVATTAKATSPSPVYTFLPYTPLPSVPLNIFAPKPFRSIASINLDTSEQHEPVRASPCRLSLKPLSLSLV